MNEALITAAVTLAVCLINNHFQQKQVEKKHDETVGLVTYRLEQLEKKVNKHNNLVERMFKVEENIEVHAEKIKVANHRIDDLEKGRS